MTVSSQTTINRSTGNGITTVFPYQFKIVAESDVEVSVNGVVKTLNVDYTVSGVGVNSGGNITFSTAPANGTTVVRRRNMSLVRTTDYQDQGTLPAATLDADVDSTVLMIQQLDERLGRTFSLPASSAADSTMPTPTGGYVLGWDALGQNLTNLPASAGTSLIDLAASSGSSLVGFIQSGTGAVTTDVQTKLRERVSVKDFGAVGDGVTDDTAAITTAIVCCQLALRNLHFPAGVYKITSTIALSGNPIGLIGEDGAPMQQGSTRPSVTLRWYGGASPMFSMASSAWSFVGMAVDNFGTATDFIYATAAQHLLLRRMSFLIGSGASQFSRAVLHSLGNNFGYSRFETIHCMGPAPRFISIDGNGTSNGLTPFSITGRSIFESNSAGPLTVVYIKDENADSIIIEGNTFNQQSGTNELCVIDTTATPLSPTLTSFVFTNNEWDSVGSVAGHRAFKLTNVKNARISGNAFQGGGSATALGDLVNTVVTEFNGNWGESIGGTVFSCDANSRVYPGVNQFNTANTSGVATDPGTGKAGAVLQVVTATYSTQTSLTAAYADLVSATITPLSKTSKILVIANVNGLAVTGTTTSIQARINRGATALLDIEKEAGYAGAVTTEMAIGGIGATYMDAPSSTSALTYKIQMQKTGGSSAFANTSGGSSTITLMELAA